MKKFVLGLLFVLLFSLTAHADAASQQDKAEERLIRKVRKGNSRIWLFMSLMST